MSSPQTHEHGIDQHAAKMADSLLTTCNRSLDRRSPGSESMASVTGKKGDIGSRGRGGIQTLPSKVFSSSLMHQYYRTVHAREVWRQEEGLCRKEA